MQRGRDNNWKGKFQWERDGETQNNNARDKSRKNRREGFLTITDRGKYCFEIGHATMRRMPAPDSFHRTLQECERLCVCRANAHVCILLPHCKALTTGAHPLSGYLSACVGATSLLRFTPCTDGPSLFSLFPPSFSLCICLLVSPSEPHLPLSRCLKYGQLVISCLQQRKQPTSRFCPQTRSPCVCLCASFFHSRCVCSWVIMCFARCLHSDIFEWVFCSFIMLVYQFAEI